MVTSVRYMPEQEACSYHSRVVVGRGRGQQRGLQQLEQQEVAHVICAELGLKAILCLALRTCHDTCTVSTSGSQLPPWLKLVTYAFMGHENLQ